MAYYLKCFCVLAQWYLVVGNAGRHSAAAAAAAAAAGQMSLRTLYDELRNRTSDEVEWYVRHAFYAAAADAANLVNVEAAISVKCLHQARASVASFSQLDRIDSVWSKLRACSKSVDADVRRQQADAILENPVEFFCRCMETSSERPRTDRVQHDAYAVALEGYYLRGMPKNLREGLEMLFEKLTSINVTRILFLEMLCSFKAADQFDSNVEGYTLFEIIKQLREYSGVGEPEITKQETFNRALEDSAVDLVQALAVWKNVSKRKKSVQRITTWMTDWIKDNLMRRFENHPHLKYQFIGRTRHLISDMLYNNFYE